MSNCFRCHRLLDYAAILCDKDTCTSCEILRLRQPDDSWSFFLRTIRESVRSDGTLHVNDVRPKIRGKVEPKRIGQFWKRAATLGLIRFKEWEQSTDEAGGNSDKLARVHLWVAAEKRVAA